MGNYLSGNKTELEHAALWSLFTKVIFGPGIKSPSHLLVQEENGETEAKRRKIRNKRFWVEYDQRVIHCKLFGLVNPPKDPWCYDSHKEK